MPRPLWGDMANLTARLLATERVLLITDFDGTLTPIVAHHEETAFRNPFRRQLSNDIHFLHGLQSEMRRRSLIAVDQSAIARNC